MSRTPGGITCAGGIVKPRSASCSETRHGATLPALERWSSVGAWRRQLETSAFAFPSDLADEGVDTVLDNLADRAGLGGITVAFSYHAARDVFPHNPRRKVRLLDRGELHFPPACSLYDGLRIQPRVNRRLLERDVLRDTCAAASERGIARRAWTIFLHADRPD